MLSRVRALIKKVARLIIRNIITYINTHPGLHRMLVALMNRLGVYKLLRSTYHRLVGPPQPINEDTFKITEDNLTPYARLIYTDLKSAISKQQVKSN
jgi:hypothetical protein